VGANDLQGVLGEQRIRERHLCLTCEQKIAIDHTSWWEASYRCGNAKPTSCQY
jgi:hypothetical protein